ncbi:gas vesicle protein GvpO [Streptomyces sp. TRM68367]|uniref:gas vesicle protein GvpO n=1 Tax=Streptomyces sp. TRM68367 TaxID=2758415 RepID=UPI00165CC3A1|nr:gas vesicle protein GvpO [Streptomyces sp. TRM68367]MBC9728683.1 gas vesicle protein [Streptomyces sp. TRM68367]
MTSSPNTPDTPKRNDNAVADGTPVPGGLLPGALEQLAGLTGLTVESVTSVERAEHGWSLEIEVLELARVPDSTSLLASYRVGLDSEGRLTGYRRLRRYARGRADPYGSGRR